MSDQPKSKIRRGEPAGEWTAEDAQDLLVRGWQGLADAHNAALAFEREEVTNLHLYGEVMEVKLRDAREKVQALVELAHFLKSVIQSGESWTATCQKQYDDALAQVKEGK